MNTIYAKEEQLISVLRKKIQTNGVTPEDSLRLLDRYEELLNEVKMAGETTHRLQQNLNKVNKELIRTRKSVN